jgi:hypothetical protein
MVSSKKNPAYSGPALKRLMVIGVSADARVRHAFEDAFVAKLKAAGIAAQPSYPVIPEVNPVDPAQLRKAVHSAGVDGVLAAKLVKVERDPTGLDTFSFENRTADFYEYYGSGSTGSFDPSSGGMSNLITIHFDLYSVAGSQLVWSGDAATYPSTDVKQVTDGRCEHRSVRFEFPRCGPAVSFNLEAVMPHIEKVRGTHSPCRSSLNYLQMGSEADPRSAGGFV